MLSWAGAPSLSEKGSFQLRRNHLSGPPEGSISRRGALQGCGVAVQERAPGRERPGSFPFWPLWVFVVVSGLSSCGARAQPDQELNPCLLH